MCFSNNLVVFLQKTTFTPMFVPYKTFKCVFSTIWPVLCLYAAESSKTEKKNTAGKGRQFIIHQCEINLSTCPCGHISLDWYTNRDRHPGISMTSKWVNVYKKHDSVLNKCSVLKRTYFLSTAWLQNLLCFNTQLVLWGDLSIINEKKQHVPLFYFPCKSNINYVNSNP